MPRILGIDPGLRKTGWGIIDTEGSNLKFIACGVLKTNDKEPTPLRLFDLKNQLCKVLESYNPDECAIEETFVNKNPISSLKLGHARGALILTVSNAQIAIKEYAATLVKKSIVGVGRAEKKQVQMMISSLLPGADVSSEDAADALAVAICHNSHRKIGVLA